MLHWILLLKLGDNFEGIVGGLITLSIIGIWIFRMNTQKSDLFKDRLSPSESPSKKDASHEGNFEYAPNHEPERRVF